MARSNHDSVEVALATALTEAATAGRFDVVAQLAREIDARRTSRSSRGGDKVIPFRRQR